MWSSVVSGNGDGSKPRRVPAPSLTDEEGYTELSEMDDRRPGSDVGSSEASFAGTAAPKGRGSGAPGYSAYERAVLGRGAKDPGADGIVAQVRKAAGTAQKASGAALSAAKSFKDAMEDGGGGAVAKALRAENGVTDTEYVFTFDSRAPGSAKRREIIGSLRKVGLIVNLEHTITGNVIMAKISAPFALLMWWAEKSQMRVELKSLQEYLALTFDAAGRRAAASNATNGANAARGVGAESDGTDWESDYSDSFDARGRSRRYRGRGGDRVEEEGGGGDDDDDDDNGGIGRAETKWEGDATTTGLDRRKPGTAVYTVRQRSLFKPFRSLERQRLIETLIMGKKFEGGAGLDIETLVDHGVGGLLQVFPVHCEEERKVLLNRWGGAMSVFRGSGLHGVRDYFGEDIAFYFAFLTFYTRALFLPGIFGLAVFITSIVQLSSDTSLTPAFSAFIALWVTVILELWKRRTATLAFTWDMLDFQKVDKVRPQFKGRPAYGFYSEDGFVKLRKSDVAGVDPRFVRKEQYHSRWKYRLTLIASYSGTFALGGLAILTSLAMLWVRMFLIQDNKTPTYTFEVKGNLLEFEVGAIGAGVLNGLAIAVLNLISKWISMRLTVWENHRTVSEFTKHLAVKLVTFQVINSYFSLVYVAFFKSGATIFGRTDSCSPDCMTELAYQLGAIFITREIIAIGQQGLMPLFLSWFAKFSFSRDLEKKGATLEDCSPEERQSHMLPTEELIDDWVELCISFGFICFVSAFPIIPILTGISTLIEIKLDSRNMLQRTQRPRYVGAKGIGVFYHVLQMLGIAAVVSNALIFGVVSNQLDSILSLSPSERVWAIVIVEHAILLLKMLIMAVIPDEPARVRRGIALRRFQKNIILGEGDVPGDEWTIDPTEVQEDIAPPRSKTVHTTTAV